MHIGTPAQGSDFFGRTKILERLQKIIQSGSHVLLSGPRRVGKTSVAQRLLYLLCNEGWNGIYVTFEGAQDETVIAQRVINALKEQGNLWNTINKGFQNIFKNANIDIEGFGIKIKYKKDDNEVANLLEALGRAIKSIDGNYLLIIDELPVFLASLEKKEDGPERVEAILNTLRSYRQYISDQNQKKVWFFCGSISLESFAATRNLSYTINDTRPFQLGAYDEDEAQAFLDLACRKHFMTFGENAKEHLLKKVGWPIPFYLAIVFEAALLQATGKTIEVSHINSGYTKALEEHKKDFDQWIQRLQLHINNPQFHIEMLKLFARNNKTNFEYIKAYTVGTEWKNLSELHLLAVLDQLVADGYIVLENGFYQYRSPLIRDYIKEKFHL